MEKLLVIPEEIKLSCREAVVFIAIKFSKGDFDPSEVRESTWVHLFGVPVPEDEQGVYNPSPVIVNTDRIGLVVDEFIRAHPNQPDYRRSDEYWNIILRQALFTDERQPLGLYLRGVPWVSRWKPENGMTERVDRLVGYLVEVGFSRPGIRDSLLLLSTGYKDVIFR